ncbi:MAG: transposase [Firmicutes bacterium]|nr:transposase [Bacillota bacterium]
MGNRGKRYSPEFKEDAIRLALSNGRSVPSVAEDLRVNPQTLYRWIKKHNDAKNDTEKNRIAELETKLKAANRRAADLEETVIILKKAAAIFAKPRK